MAGCTLVRAMNDNSKRLPPVPTLWLFGYLATVYAWLAEMSLAILHFVARVDIPVIPHVTVLCVTLALTLFSWWRRADYTLLRPSRGRILLTRLQSAMVATFVVGLSLLGAWVAMSMAGN